MTRSEAERRVIEALPEIFVEAERIADATLESWRLNNPDDPIVQAVFQDIRSSRTPHRDLRALIIQAAANAAQRAIRALPADDGGLG